MTTPTTSGTRRTDKQALLAHRNNFHLNQLVGPLLRLRDLTPEAQNLLTRAFMTNVAYDPSVPADRVYVETLHTWGVMCPHPMVRRLYDGFRPSDVPLPFEMDPWFLCTLCQTKVVNRDT